MMQDALPRIKTFLKALGLDEVVESYVARFLVAFSLHIGRMSATQVGQAIRFDPRHRAQVLRFLVEGNWPGDFFLLSQAVSQLLEYELRRSGDWLLIIDQTYCTQQGIYTQNTFSHGKKEKSGKDRRHRKKSSRRQCHCYVMGLLITPTGLRLPLYRSYFTKEYLKELNKKRGPEDQIPYRRQTELAAELILTAPVPPEAKVVVLGDTAFDAEAVQKACAQRSYSWIVPINKERVLSGEKPRRKVWSLVDDFQARQFSSVRLTPGKGRFVAQRRVAACRIGPKAKTRTYYVHQERHNVQSVGNVQLVFSTTISPQRGKPVVVQKVLMTNDLTLSVARIVEMYDLRWQIELFFKELKSVLGLHQYRFGEFTKAEHWVQLCLTTFVYLEWYRAGKLAQRNLSDKERRWWQWQRTHGLCTALRHESEERELGRLVQLAKTPSGLRKLKKILRAARQLEARNAA